MDSPQKKKRVLSDEQREANRIRSSAFYRDNKDRMRETNKLWKKENRETVLALDKAYRDRNRDRLNREARERHAANPVKKVYTEEERAKRRDKYHSDEARRESIKAKARAYFYENKGKIKERNRKSYLKNRKEICQEQRDKGKAYRENKKLSDPEYSSRNAAKQRERRAKNRELILEQDRIYRNSPQRKAYLERTKDKRAAYFRKRYKEKPEVRAYYATLQGRGKKYYEVLEKWKACGGLCYICGFGVLESEITIDHVHPRPKGGTNDVSNLMPVHKSCNSHKRDKLNHPAVRPYLIEMVRFVPAELEEAA